MKVKIINDSMFPTPEYGTAGSSGMDLRADLSDLNELKVIGEFDGGYPTLYLHPQARAIIPTNLYIQLPPGYEAQVRPRSGQAFKKGLMVLNSPGTIDSDYTGNIGVIVANYTDKVIEIANGERIAQLVISKYEKIDWEDVKVLDKTERGAGGFGSTGIK